MSTIDEVIANSKKRAEHARREKRLQDRLAREHKRKTDARRHYIIGELVTKYFPEVLYFEPRRTKAENAVEFKPLEALLAMLAADEELMAQLKKEKSQQASAVNRQGV